MRKIEGSADFITAAASNERVLVAVKWKKTECIYSGTVNRSEQDKKSSNVLMIFKIDQSKL
jgi:hypothetical protein